jgi:hypothetical protein
MTAKRIPDLDALAGASTANDDNLVIFDTSANATKRILRSQLAAGIVGDLPYSGRTMVAKLGDTVSVGDYGAVGDGTTDDTSAIQAACDYIKSIGGGNLLFGPSKTYRSGTVNIAAGICIDLNGSTIKMLDNQPDFTRLFTMAATGYYYDGALDSKPLTIKNGVLDCNRANQGTYTGYELEHQAAICLGTTTTSVGNVVVHIHDLDIRECCGDGINLYHGVKGLIENCHFWNHFRGGVVSSGGGHALTISDCTSGGDVHDKAIDFEPISSAGQAYKLAINNFFVGGKVDISAKYCEGSSITVSNLRMTAHAFTMFGSSGSKFVFNDCTLYTTDNSNVSVVRQWYDVEFNRCLFVGTKSVGATEPVSGVYLWHDSVAGQVARFNFCKFTVDGTVVAGDTAYGVYQNASTIATMPTLYFNNCEWVGFDYALWTRGGVLEVTQCKADGPFFYIRGTVGTYENTVTINNRLTIPAGAVPFTQDGSTAQVAFKFYNYELDAGNGSAGAGENTLLFSGFTNVTKIGRRVLFVTSTPSGGGFAGDIAVLTAPTAGNIAAWVATTTSNTAATWKAAYTLAV